MDKEFQTTSFIPKKPLTEERRVSEKKPVGFIFMVGLLLFFISIIFGVGVYFYRSYLQKDIIELDKSLSLAEDEFERGLVEELQRLESRLNASSEILSSHIALSPIFEILEDVTLETIRYKEFNSAKSGEPGGLIDISLSGEAVSYAEVALQSDILAKNKNLRNIVFSGLELTESGDIVFNLDFSVSPTLVLYERNIENQFSEEEELLMLDDTMLLEDESENSSNSSSSVPITNNIPGLSIPSVPVVNPKTSTQ